MSGRFLLDSNIIVAIFAEESAVLSHEPNEPPHVHVDRDNLSAKFWLRPVALARNATLYTGIRPSSPRAWG